jgi:hypothetical protein
MTRREMIKTVALSAVATVSGVLTCLALPAEETPAIIGGWITDLQKSMDSCLDYEDCTVVWILLHPKVAALMLTWTGFAPNPIDFSHNCIYLAGCYRGAKVYADVYWNPTVISIEVNFTPPVPLENVYISAVI